MANALDEVTGPVDEEGRDVHVISKQIPVVVGGGSKFFQIFLWFLGIIPGLVFLIMKINAKSYLRALEQQINSDASTIDNYQDQRVDILKNCAKLLDKSIKLDKETFESIAAYRSGVTPNTDGSRNEVASAIDDVNNKINIAFENYPDLKAHDEIADAMQQNSYLRKEVTAARDQYNDRVAQWNRDIQAWPTKMIAAAEMKCSTRIPFSISKEKKAEASGTFF